MHQQRSLAVCTVKGMHVHCECKLVYYLHAGLMSSGPACLHLAIVVSELLERMFKWLTRISSWGELCAMWQIAYERGMDLMHDLQRERNRFWFPRLYKSHHPWRSCPSWTSQMIHSNPSSKRERTARSGIQWTHYSGGFWKTLRERAKFLALHAGRSRTIWRLLIDFQPMRWRT